MNTTALAAAHQQASHFLIGCAEEGLAFVQQNRGANNADLAKQSAGADACCIPGTGTDQVEQLQTERLARLLFTGGDVEIGSYPGSRKTMGMERP